MVKCVPIFCCTVARDKALGALKREFPDLSMTTSSGWAGETGIEIELPRERLDEVTGFIEESLALIFVRFGCAN
ncbi:MAG: hypothetical protein WC518_01130 [Patescibacteria group bacterium]